MQGTLTSQNYIKKEQSWRIHTSWFKNTAKLITAMWYWHEDKHIDQRNWEFRDKATHLWSSDLTKVSFNGNHSVGRTDYSKNSAGVSRMANASTAGRQLSHSSSLETKARGTIPDLTLCTFSSGCPSEYFIISFIINWQM